MARDDGSHSFESFAAAHGQQLMRLAYVLTEDAQAAEDITQTALLRMHQRWDSIRQPQSYGRRAIANGVIDHSRRRSREVLVTSDILVHLAGADVPDAEEPGLAGPLRCLIPALPPRQRMALVFRYYEQLEIPEIAATMGLRQSSVRSAIARALNTLRTELAAIDRRTTA